MSFLSRIRYFALSVMLFVSSAIAHSTPSHAESREIVDAAEALRTAMMGMAVVGFCELDKDFQPVWTRRETSQLRLMTRAGLVAMGRRHPDGKDYRLRTSVTMPNLSECSAEGMKMFEDGLKAARRLPVLMSVGEHDRSQAFAVEARYLVEVLARALLLHSKCLSEAGGEIDWDAYTWTIGNLKPFITDDLTGYLAAYLAAPPKGVMLSLESEYRRDQQNDAAGKLEWQAIDVCSVRRGDLDMRLAEVQALALSFPDEWMAPFPISEDNRLPK